METLNVTIKPEHFQRATGFGDPFGCPLAVALKEILPDGSEVSVALGGLSITYKEGKSVYYKIPYLTIWGAASSEYSYGDIQRYILKAKESLVGIPTVEIELTLLID